MQTLNSMCKVATDFNSSSASNTNSHEGNLRTKCSPKQLYRMLHSSFDPEEITEAVPTQIGRNSSQIINKINRIFKTSNWHRFSDSVFLSFIIFFQIRSLRLERICNDNLSSFLKMDFEYIYVYIQMYSFLYICKGFDLKCSGLWMIISVKRITEKS